MNAIAMRRSRIPVPVAALCAAALLLTLPRPRLLAQTVKAPERVAVIDVRPAPPPSGPQSRAAFTQALARRPGIALVTEATDPELARALAGELGQTPAELALAEASQALAQGDCTRTVAAAGRAIMELSAAQAAGADTADALKRGYAHWLVCAHRASETDAAVTAAQRLHGLGADAPVAPVTEEIWNAYPQIDAMIDRGMAQVTIATEPAGGDVWIDHRRVGPAPVTVVLSEGLHMVAAAQGNVAGAQELAVTWKVNTALVTMAPLPSAAAKATAWDDLARVVARWRKAPPDPAEIGAALSRAGVRFGVLLTAAGQVPAQESPQGSTPASPPLQDVVDIWVLAPGETVAKRIATTSPSEPDVIARAIRGETKRYSRTGPDPEVPLLREGDVPTLFDRRRAREREDEAQPWWVYVLVIGAVAVAGGVIIADAIADDHQRIEVVWPPPMQPILRW